MCRNDNARRSRPSQHGCPRRQAHGLHSGEGMSSNSALRERIEILDTPQFLAGQGAISFRFFVVLDVRAAAAARADNERAAGKGGARPVCAAARGQVFGRASNPDG
jgi:hypothetical protein